MGRVYRRVSCNKANGIDLISVTEALGSALIGLGPGQTISWHEDQTEGRITVLDANKSRLFAADVEELLSDVAKLAKARGVQCAVLQVEREHPHEAIIDVAVREKCDLIVMASHRRRGLAAVILGALRPKC